MIVRIVGEGQFELPDSAVTALEPFDDQLEKAVKAGDEAGVSEVLTALHEAIIQAGKPVADDVLVDSDLIVPAADASVAEVRELLDESDEGLIPNS